MSEDLNKYGNYFTEAARPEDCIVCRRCELYCPDFAISVEEIEDESENQEGEE